MKHIKFLLIAVCLFASIAACNKKEDPDNIVPVESVTIAPEQITLTVGQTHQLEVTVLPENATDQTVKWRTSDASIVSIDNGEITANAAGTASITAKVGGKEATCTVIVAENVIPVTSVSIEPKQLEMIPGQTTAITVTLLPENATDKTVVWSSSEETVATVSDTGLVQAVAEGTTTISATSLDGEVSGECLVTVMAAENMTGSRQDVITQDDFGGSGSTGDDVSGGSGASQGDENSNKNGINYVYGENTVAVTDAVMEKVSNLTKEGFKLPADSHGRSSIGYGDVFVFPKCEQFPGGYAAKVTDISWEGDGFYYSTTLAAIDEVFDTLHLEQTALDLTPYIEKIVREDGTEVEWTRTKGGVSIPIPEIFGGINGLSFDLNDNVSISPSAEINFNLDVDTDVVGNKLTYAKVQANSSARLSADVSIKKGGEKKWVSKRAKVIIAAIPVGPVWVTPEVYATFEIRLSGEINMTFSFNYQKTYYAYTIYDGSGINCAGGASVSSSEDPFAVTGNLSGGIEFGPNVGAGVSLWGGALGVGVYCGPHAAFSFTGTLPFTAENLAKLDRPGMWLSNAYYEPSALLRYGGSVEVAYLWHKDVEAPETFSYSFGRTFIIPTLGKKLDIQTSKGGKASISTTIRNKAMFCDNIYVNIRQGGPEGPVLFKCPFKMSRKPEAEDDEVKITTSVSDLEPGTYYVDGPFITLSALGLTKEVEMTPVQDADRYIKIKDDSDRRFLVDLYKQTNGDNWINNDNWCSEKDLADWYGVETNEEGRVTSLNLNSNHLSSSLLLNLSDLPFLTSFSIDNNDLVSIDITGNNNIRKLYLSNCAKGTIWFNEFDEVIIENCPELESIGGSCPKLTVKNCNFGDNWTPFSRCRDVDECLIYGCYMPSCGLHSNILRFESSTTYDTWHCSTRERLEIINSRASTICGGDFAESTTIVLQNATLWRSNWNDDSLVTLTCTIRGRQWDALFDN